ncbi:prolyl oligopeptidase family serine peptidase [Aestuariibaculum sp. YM273]|uniref:alpha/beta hydrolase family protein n=1 Tax=Aestuariibaculum sp. YM273 TaxID=3070659 RepID=UPI0027DAFF18|nr:prolyl oligopeptidase family serine peptidase [Aestuariibaculum sp. YM273]WMI66935.1 prolyl oligopeptidase family serine peptidase [Aestuariibaculum sp. YM273]
MKLSFTYLLILISFTALAQKKALEFDNIQQWNSIKNETIAPNGDFVAYDLEQDHSDSHLYLNSGKGETLLEYFRASQGQFSYDSKFLAFTIKPLKDSVDNMLRQKVKKDKLPKDSLGIYNIDTNELDKIANVKSYQLPEKWSGYIAYVLEDIKAPKKENKTDSTETKEDKKEAKPKKVSKTNGYHLVIRNLNTKAQDTFKYVTHYTFAKTGKTLAFSTTGKKDNEGEGVYIYDFNTSKLTNIYSGKKAKYNKLSFSETGTRFAFVVDADTTKVQIRPNELCIWESGEPTATKLYDNNTTPEGYLVSKDGTIKFSKDESKLYFGLRKPPIIKDTTLLKDEIVNVEVWTYNEPRLYTVQELQVKNDTIKSYETVYNFNTKKTVQIETEAFPYSTTTDKGNSNIALANTPMPYALESQWTGRRLKDYAIIDTKTGTQKVILKQTPNASLSPKGEFVFGYHSINSTWFTYNVKTDKYLELTKNKPFYDELNDSPDFPRSYGAAGWLEDDNFILLYDRYDIWKFNPNTGEATNLTNGRESKTVYRYIKLDKEEESISPKDKWLLSTFNEATKAGGYAEFNPRNNSLKQLEEGDFNYSRPTKAELSDKLLFTRESFVEFPNLRLTDFSFKKQTVLSDANPQQKDYNWGTIELVKWTSLDGEEMEGLLAKPENFNPNKKYPMIVNFYERSSDDIHRHRPPSFVRSTISYSYYTSRGYVIFNPDVKYREGYPGESALSCVVSGTNAMIKKGFIDKDNIGLQGHSWGGYQIAYLVTKTDMFKAAESGAPVANMISAYGGIRWWTGLSRQFQYEHTQSRIGGTPWEYPMRYIENSPIFNIDKINTPLLILHNDADGHVPWYQGIEFFVSLRRLGKPAWFLNYNDEPHWPLKYQNRKDFTLRKSQFFDYYLQDAPKPLWMERGVPAVEKGINQGYELIED